MPYWCFRLYFVWSQNTTKHGPSGMDLPFMFIKPLLKRRTRGVLDAIIRDLQRETHGDRPDVIRNAASHLVLVSHFVRQILGECRRTFAVEK